MRKIINLNRKWSFRKGVNEVPAVVPADWDFVNIPHCWNAIDGQDGDNDYYRGTAYYAKRINKMELPKADRYYLEIRGANSSADVYLNGKNLAHTQHKLSHKTKTLEESQMAELIEDELNIYAEGEDFSYVFSKHYGVFTSIVMLLYSLVSLNFISNLLYSKEGQTVKPALCVKMCAIKHR